MGQFDASGNYVVDDSDYAGYTPPGGYTSQKRNRFGSFLNSFMRPQQQEQPQYGDQASAQMIRRPGILGGLAGQSGAGGVLGSIGKVARIFI